MNTVLGAIRDDVREAWRTLRRSGKALLIVMPILAVGIGLNVAVFSIVNTLFFRPLGVPDGNQLVYIYRFQFSDRRTTLSDPDNVAFFEARKDVFSGISAHNRVIAPFAVDGEVTETSGEAVLGNYFELLGVAPHLGRTLLRVDDNPANTELAVVISYDLWMRQFKGDRNVLGRPVRLNDKHFTIVGVMGPQFRGLCESWKRTEWWVTDAAFFGRDGILMALFARLRPGVTLTQAQAVVAVLAARMQEEQYRKLPPRFRRSKFVADPYIVRKASSVLTPFDPDAGTAPARLAAAATIVAAIVLLVAVLNVAGVLAVRMVARSREFGVRLALGAAGVRLARQLVLETTMMAVTASGAGLGVAWFVVGMFGTYAPFRFDAPIILDKHVLLFTGLLCLGVAISSGLVHLVHAKKVDIRTAMGNGTVGPTRRGRLRLRCGILVPQVACATALLVVVAIHGRALWHVEAADRGYRAEGITVFRVSLWDLMAPTARVKRDAIRTGQRQAESRAFFEKVYSKLQSGSGYDAALADRLPVYSDATREYYTSRENYLSAPEATTAVSVFHVSPGYFRTLGMELVRGRGFERDALATAGKAVVSDSLARQWWPGQDPIGKTISPYSPTARDRTGHWYEVAGVVNDVAPVEGDRPPFPALYLSLQAWDVPWGYVISRSTRGSAESAIRSAVLASDPFAQVTGTQTLEEILDGLLFPRRAAFWILAGAALLGVMLACVGLYGLIAYSVMQRLAEFGIRTVLGATRGSILALVLRDGAGIGAIGAVPGFLAGVFAIRSTSTLVRTVPTHDAVAFTFVPIVLVIVILASCYLPARRALRVSPRDLFLG